MDYILLCYREQPQSIEDVMKLITKELSPEDNEFEASLHIDVRRKYVLHDALREGRKKKFTTRKNMEGWS